MGATESAWPFGPEILQGRWPTNAATAIHEATTTRDSKVEGGVETPGPKNGTAGRSGAAGLSRAS